MGLTFPNCLFQPILVKSKLTEVAEDKVEVAVFIYIERFIIIPYSFCV
jgi:hypothetical protein